MADTKKPYDVVVFEEYMSGEEKKSKSYQVGVAFENQNGGFTVNLPVGVTLYGRFSILPRKEKTETP